MVLHRPNESGRPFKLTLEEEFFSVLLRLRLGLLLEVVADRFSISIGTASSIFSTWIEVMACQLQHVFPWPTRELVHSHTPPQFQKYQYLHYNRLNRSVYTMTIFTHQSSSNIF